MTKTTANRDLKNHVYGILKDRIIHCIYPPGSILNEAQIAAELGFSRTPVREAISRLETDNFLKVMPKKGIYIRDIQLSDVIQIFQARTEIEPIAVRMAGPRLPKNELLLFCDKFNLEVSNIQNGFQLDTAMHLFIIEHCGNQFIIDMMHKVFDENTRIIISSKQNQIQIHDARLEHLEIITTLLEEDFEKAAQIMRAHIDNCKHAALDYFYSLQTCIAAPSETYKNHLKKYESSIGHH